jgi:hypothetical protein
MIKIIYAEEFPYQASRKLIRNFDEMTPEEQKVYFEIAGKFSERFRCDNLGRTERVTHFVTIDEIF